MGDHVSEFEHRYRIGEHVKYPEDNELKRGSIDKVIFEKTERSGKGKLKYSIVPMGSSPLQAVTRSQKDLISA